MSRYKRIGPAEFDKKASHKKATTTQLELLAAAENVSIDDILDEGLNQGQVRHRLVDVFHKDIIPHDVLERRRLAKEAAKIQPSCRICDTFGWECDGSITRHHFVPRWMMLLLDNYVSYASRAKCTIPICMGRHRDLHLRSDDETPKSIAQFLTDDERKFAQKMLDELKEQHPAVFDLIAGGDETATYESQLVRDYIHGAFREASRDYTSKRLGLATG